jgi:hypothetical protein
MRCECGARVDLAARNAFRYGSASRSPVCQSCRARGSVRVTPELREWWTSRYALEELRELAAGLGDS